jgi:hypothetical protein
MVEDRRAPSPQSSSQSSISSPQMIPGSAETPRPTITDQTTDPISGELADLVESMIGRGRNGRQIWTELIDHHDYLITYGSTATASDTHDPGRHQHEQRPTDQPPLDSPGSGSGGWPTSFS